MAARLLRLVPRAADAPRPAVPATLRRSAGLTWVGLTALALGYNGWLLSQGLAPREHALRLARRTEWKELDADTFIGSGQRMWTTDTGETALLDVRHVELLPAASG